MLTTLNPKYSVCLTHRNNKATLEASIQSILSQLDSRFEVVVVDSESNDGSTSILEDLAYQGRIRLIQKKCSRGEGRQIAFENSKGSLIIANLDTDEVYVDRLRDLLELYHNKAEGDLLFVFSDISKTKRGRQNVTIAPRRLIESLGGWRNVNYGEDWDLWRRAAQVSRFRSVVFPLVTGPDPSWGKQTLRSRLTKYISMIQLGRNVFGEEEVIRPSQRLTFALAKIVAVFRPKFEGQKVFDPYQVQFMINSPPA